MCNNVAYYRNLLGLTQDELAMKLNISRQFISAIERGTKLPSIKLAFKISKILDIELEKLFFYTKDELQLIL